MVLTRVKTGFRVLGVLLRENTWSDIFSTGALPSGPRTESLTTKETVFLTPKGTFRYTRGSKTSEIFQETRSTKTSRSILKCHISST